MAYGNNRSRNGNGNGNNRGGLSNVSVNLSIEGESSVDCASTKNYSDSFVTNQEVSSNSGNFISLVKASKDPAESSVHNAKVVLVKNISNITAELLFKVQAWKNSSSVDAVNGDDLGLAAASSRNFRYWSTILPAGEFLYLPNSRYVAYENNTAGTVESAAYAPVGAIAIEPKDIHSGNEFSDVREIDSATYGTGTEELTNEAVAIGETAIDVDDASWFKAGDLIMIDDEVMEVLSISTNTLTVKRGLLGSIDVAHTEDDELHYFFGNEYLPFNVGKCMSDKDGKFKQRGAFFGYARTTDHIADGLVAGSVAINIGYTEGGYLDWGLQGIKGNDRTGLAASTAYAITFVIDEYNVGGIDSTSTEQIVTFTTDSSDTTFAGSSNAVLPKIQDAIDAFYYDTSSGLKNKRVTIGLHNGDVRVTSHSNHSETRVGIAVSTSGTTPFDVGRFPARVDGDQPKLLGSSHGTGATDIIVYGPISSLAPETIDDPVTSKEITNTSAFIFDDGNGNLVYMGSQVGTIDYEKGHCEWQIPSLPEAEFKIYGQSHSAHSGGYSYVVNGYNSIQEISGRSVNAKEKSKLQVVIYG